MRLSAAIITYNEQANIAECIASVHDWVDEVLVLDSFSTDQTQSICRSFSKVRFEQHHFDGHIEQKNRALSMCRGDWILCLDADERVSPELAQSLRQFLQNPPATIVAAQFPRLTMHSGAFIRHCGWYPNSRYRLVRKGYAQWQGENPHDFLVIQGKGVQLKGDLLHYSFVDLADQVDTINQFSSVAALMRYNRGVRFRWWRLFVIPCWKWLEIYIVKRGFLDGARGFFIAMTSAYSSFLKEAKLYELDRLGLPKPSNLGSRYDKNNNEGTSGQPRGNSYNIASSITT